MMFIYCDGGCRPNPGKGAAGFIVVDNTKQSEFHRSVEIYDETTNNRMELQAAINAVDWFYQNYYDKGVDLTIIVDSQYVQLGITEWIKKWKTNSWKNSKNKPVENKEMWHDLDRLVGWLDVNIKWQWTKGHGDDKWNNLIDQVCTNALTIPKTRLLEEVITEGKKTIKDLKMTDLNTYIIMIANGNQSFEKKIGDKEIYVRIENSNRDVYTYFTLEGEYLRTVPGN